MRSRKALVVLKRRFLGDTIMACPLIDAVATNFDDTAVQTGELNLELLQDRAYQVRFLSAKRPESFVETIREARALRKHSFDVAFLVNRNLRSALISMLARIPKRVGHSTEGRGLLLTHRVPYVIQRFEGECYLDLARAVGIQAPDARPTIAITDAERRRGSELVCGATVGLQPGARHAYKKISVETLAKVGRALAEVGERIALVGGPEEKEDAARFEELVGIRVVNLVGKTSLRETLGTLASLKLMAGSDTGVIHMAAAVGTPTVAVIGPEPPKKWGHHYLPHRVIGVPDGDVQNVSAEEILAECRKVLGSK